MNRDIDVTQQYVNASQLSNQTVRFFAVYLSTLENDLSVYTNEQKQSHLFIKLRSEIRMIIINVQLVFITRDSLVDLVFRLENNLRKERSMSKRHKDKNDSNVKDKNKNKSVKKNKSYKSEKIDVSVKIKKTDVSSRSRKNVFNVIC